MNWKTIGICLIGILWIGSMKAQTNHSLIAFTNPEKDLLPESVAFDSQTNTFYMGSTRKGKVVKRNADGTYSDFIKSKQDGLWMIIGMKIDPVRRVLWLCSSGGNNLVGYNLVDTMQGRPAGVFKYDLDRGTLIQKYVLDKKGEVHFFNDLVIHPNGDVYITHMFQEAKIYRIRNGRDELELFSTSPNLSYPNGLCLSNDGQHLFIAHSNGIEKIELATKSWSALSVPEGLSVSRRESMDGLYWYNNSLIGIQQDTKMVQQLFLNKEMTEVTHNKVWEAEHPMMDSPTTGVLVEDAFYYISNAQFGRFDQAGNLFPMDRLYEVIVLRVDLNK